MPTQRTFVYVRLEDGQESVRSQVSSLLQLSPDLYPVSRWMPRKVEVSIQWNGSAKVRRGDFDHTGSGSIDAETLLPGPTAAALVDQLHAWMKRQ